MDAHVTNSWAEKIYYEYLNFEIISWTVYLNFAGHVLKTEIIACLLIIDCYTNSPICFDLNEIFGLNYDPALF